MLLQVQAAYTTRRVGPASSGIEAEPSQPSADHGDVLLGGKFRLRSWPSETLPRLQLVALHALPEARSSQGLRSSGRDVSHQLPSCNASRHQESARCHPEETAL